MFTIKKIATGLMVVAFVWALNTVTGFGGCGSTRGSSSDSGGSSGTGSGGSTGSTTGTTTAGTADVSSLRTVPSTDISTLDLSQSSSASALQTASRSALALKVVEEKGTKLGSFKDALDAVDKPSRAGCESNMHKKEVIRMSRQAQLPRCYVEAMEKAKLITIPAGERALYNLTPPAAAEDDKDDFCDGIPAERTEEKAACESEVETGPEEIKIRVGVIDNALQLDMCFNGSLEEEATYSADGAVYTASIVHAGEFQGRSESSSFSMTVDLGATGKVTDGVVSLGDGTATATANVDGGFGTGFIGFEATASYNALRGAFAGNFVDPFTQKRTTFTGKAYAKFNATEGCAKFSFTGSPPPMRLSDMVPYSVDTAALGDFLQAFSGEICGLTEALTSTNYTTVAVCPNPDFDPNAASATDCPMVAAEADGSCGTVTHSETECFAISNGVTTSEFGGRKITQTFQRIASATARYFTEVAAYNVDALSESITTPAFSRSWDCGGTFTAIKFEGMSQEDGRKIEGYMQECFAMEEGLRDEEGMGGYNCQSEEMANGAEELHEEGPPNFGQFGGQLQRTSNVCGSGRSPESIFVNPIDTPHGSAEYAWCYNKYHDARTSDNRYGRLQHEHDPCSSQPWLWGDRPVSDLYRNLHC
ncbi:MAG: hypothetical protein HYW02_00275 [Deltaproteobacteria bacterium]|nr:hypothetical protein [Deltaproteobacteria bacterium]